MYKRIITKEQIPNFNKELAILLKENGEVEEAEQLYTEVLVINPNDIEALIELAILSEDKGFIRKSRTTFIMDPLTRVKLICHKL